MPNPLDEDVAGEPAPRRSLSLRLQVMGWLLLINFCAFLSGGLWLKNLSKFVY